MIGWPEEIFEKKQTGVCVLKPNRKVFYQNQACRKICGRFIGFKCPQTCVSSCEKILGRRISSEGPEFFPNLKMGGQRFDALFFGESPYRMVMLYPLQKECEAWLNRFRNRGLSRRESEIAQWCLQGHTNSTIARKLFISEATLKTHLNNIYKKIPEARLESWRKRLYSHPVPFDRDLRELHT